MVISIHAPRTGSDSALACSRLYQSYFNPRSPHGERQSAATASASSRTFQSTLPARGATFRVDAKAATMPTFQSTLPARGATQMMC